MKNVWLAVVVGLCVLSAGACDEARRASALAPQLMAGDAGVTVHAAALLDPATEAASIQLPPEQLSSAYTFEFAGTDANDWRLYRVRIGPDGNPSLVALDKLTPLFTLDGKSAPDYVTQIYFGAYPHRTPRSIQPGDEFLLPLPPDAFVVRWQEEHNEAFGQPAKVRDYVSERGDYLRYYLTDPFPVQYELQSAGDPGRGVIHFSVDLAYMLGKGLIDPPRLAQLIYRVSDPDIFQTEAVRKFITTVRPGVESQLEVDRTHPYLDRVRELLPLAASVEPVTANGRWQLWRYTFAPAQGGSYLAIEDALGTLTDLNALPEGRPFRIKYRRDGIVQVYYKTGTDDARGKRDPYALREDRRWGALYAALAPEADNPLKWGPGEPADLVPFPSARDTRQRDQGSEPSYNFLVPGRVMVLTFAPRALQSNARAEGELRDLLGDLRDRYQPLIEQMRSLGDQLRTRGSSSTRP